MISPELPKRPNRMLKCLLLIALLAFSVVYINRNLRKEFDLKSKPPFIEDRKNTTITLDDIELITMKGQGTVSVGFQARIQGLDGLYIVKITGDHLTHYSDTEIYMYGILNAPPTIPNIPKLEFAINSMPNPFDSRAYLEDILHVDHITAKWMVRQTKISVMVMEYLDNHRLPTTIGEIRIFLRSLLFTLSFAHSRNVMMCDLYKDNVYFDGTTVKIFDWNAGFIYKPNSVKMHYHTEPSFLMPPEAWNNDSAVHATVSGFDVWSTGLLLRKLLENAVDDDSVDNGSYALANGIMKVMLTEDPYQRPDTNKLLQHPFLQDTT